MQRARAGRLRAGADKCLRTDPWDCDPDLGGRLLWFGASGVLALIQGALPRAWAALLAGLAWSVAGLLTALFLVYVEIVQLGALCAWCSAAHVLVLLTLLLTLARLERLPRAQPEPHGTLQQP